MWKDKKVTNDEKNALYEKLTKTTAFHTTLVSKFADPLDKKRTPVAILVDSTKIKVPKVFDSTVQKRSFYYPKGIPTLLGQRSWQ